MKKFKNIYLPAILLTLLVMAAPLARAQRHHGGAEGKEAHLAQMKTELGLSDEQVVQLKAIHEKYDPQFQALRTEEGELDREKMHELHRAMREESKAVFTEEQRAKMKEMHPEGRGGHHGMHRGKGHHRMGEGGHGGYGHHMGSRKGNKEVQAYVKENIRPVLQAQRAKLDAQMAAEDKTQVESLRAELKEMRSEFKGVKAEKREFRKDGQRPTEEQRAKMKAFHEKRHAIMEQAGAIALKYQSQLEALHQEILPQAEQWKTDIQAIKAKYQDEKPEGRKYDGKGEGQTGKAQCQSGDKAHCKDKGHCEAKGEGMAGCEGGRGMGHHGHQRGDFEAMKRKMEAAHFILMDPATANTKAATSAETVAAAKLDIFPNPTANQNTISYEVKKAGKVTIELLDSKGQVVRQVLSATREAGSFSQEVDLSSLSSGVYFYRITDATGARSKNFTVTK